MALIILINMYTYDICCKRKIFIIIWFPFQYLRLQSENIPLLYIRQNLKSIGLLPDLSNS